MTTPNHPRKIKAKHYKRIVGDVQGREAGPIVIVLGGVHGNEYTGIETLTRFFKRIKAEKPHFRGRLLGLQGNMKALQRQYRYVDEDLNRIWTESIIRQVRSSTSRTLYSVERRELKALLEIIDPLIEDTDQPVYVIDLHSFSADEGMFAISSRHESHTSLLQQMDVPVVYGLGEELGGTVLDYFRRMGHVALAFEGGTHGGDKTVNNKMAILYQLLGKTGNLGRPHEYDVLHDHAEYLRRENQHYPAYTELIYRYEFEENDNFAMRPGFSNFHWVDKGEHLANDRYGKIHASYEGYLLMPLYQEQGTDGFFLIRGQ